MFLCQKHYQTFRPDKNFRMYRNLIFYLMRYTFSMVNLVLASAGQMCGRYLTWLFFKVWRPNLDLVGFIFYTLGINLTSGLMPDNVAIT